MNPYILNPNLLSTRFLNKIPKLHKYVEALQFAEKYGTIDNEKYEFTMTRPQVDCINKIRKESIFNETDFYVKTNIMLIDRFKYNITYIDSNNKNFVGFCASLIIFTGSVSIAAETTNITVPIITTISSAIAAKYFHLESMKVIKKRACEKNELCKILENIEIEEFKYDEQKHLSAVKYQNRMIEHESIFHKPKRVDYKDTGCID